MRMGALWAVVLVTLLGLVELSVSTGVLASGFLEYFRCIPWQQLMVAAAEKSLAHM